MTTASKARRKENSANRSVSTAWTLRASGTLQVLKARSLVNCDWLVHGFSTRPGGVSELEIVQGAKKISERCLNLGLAVWDQPSRVEKNRELFFGSIGAGKMEFVGLKQIHSPIIHSVDDVPRHPLQGDAVITQARGLLLTVQTADCIPILIADPKNRAVAAIHSGWRGTVRRIAGKTVGRMRMLFGTEPSDLIAAIGPGIARCCYEVGPEVVKEFESQFQQARDWFEGPFDALASGEDPNPLPWLTMRPPGHPPDSPTVMLDLHAANRAILIEAGLDAKNITVSDLCTSCRPDLFFSYRREQKFGRETGRMMAAIGIL